MMRMVRTLRAAAVIGAALSACRDVQGKTGRAEDTSYRLRPGYVIDSVKPIEVELAAFRANLGPAPARLTGGARSFERLLSDFSRAVTTNDSTALRRMQISAAEFAWLVYPSSPFTRPPFAESPRMVWYQLRAGGNAGLQRLIARRGGAALTIVAHQCDPDPLIEGENKLWRHCAVTTRSRSGKTARERLFGVVIERDGHFKFASYQNQY